MDMTSRRFPSAITVSTEVRTRCRLRDVLAQIAEARHEQMARTAVVARILDTCPMPDDSIARHASCVYGRERRLGCGAVPGCRLWYWQPQAA